MKLQLNPFNNDNSIVSVSNLEDLDQSTTCDIFENEEINNTFICNHLHNQDNLSDNNIFQEWIEQPNPYTLADQVATALLSILKDMNAPLWSFKRIMNWANNAYNLGYKFDSKHNAYQTTLYYYEKQYHFDYIRPLRQKTYLEGHQDPIYTCYFLFFNQLQSSLNNTFLNNENNLVINKNNPYGKYENEENLLGELLTGSWYNKSYDHLIQDPEKDFLCPFIGYCDACKISEKSQYGAY